MDRLNRSTVGSALAAPAWTAEPGDVRIAHLGPGPFHRAHQAVFTDDVHAATGERWGIAACSSRSDRAVTALREQDGLYTVISRDGAGTTARIVGVIASAGPRIEFAARLTDPAVTVATLTVTERHYPRRAGDIGLDRTDSGVSADLATGTTASLPGLLHAGLLGRWRAGGAPIAVISCDNLRANGALTGALVREFAADAAAPAEYRDWLEHAVSFPNTVVDRLVPAPTDDDRADAARLIGRRDDAAVATEPYAAWIIERGSAATLPPWDRAGARYVADTTGAERTKLHLLNGAHSLLAALGLLAGLPTIAAAMAVDPLARAIERFHEREVLPHLVAGRGGSSRAGDEGLDPVSFAADVRTRFTNSALGHPLAQIVALGSLKLAERIVPLATTDGDLDLCALAVAAWLHVVECDERIGVTIAEPAAAAVRTALPHGAGRALDVAGLVADGDRPAFVATIAALLADLRRADVYAVVQAVLGD